MDKIDKTDKAYLEANELYNSGEWSDAEKAFLTLFENYPKDSSLAITVGNIYYSIGKLKAATEYYQKALDLKPGFSVANYKLGVCFFRIGRLKDSLEAFKNVLKIPNQSHAMASYFIGLIGFLMGQDNEAEKSFSQFRKISSESLIANFFLAQLKLKEHKFDQAQELLSELLEQSPEFSEGCYLMGQSLYGQHKNTEAIVWYRKALDLSPSDERIKSKLTLMTEMDW